MDQPSDAGFGVYVHWPYCAAKCPYCDFNSHVPRGAVNEQRYAKAVIRELEHHAALTPGRRVDTIFFGGGTPSLMQPDTVASVIDAIAALWPLASDAEVTLEANPSSVEAARFAGYRAAGVNRVSLGVQSLRDDALQFLGRLHSAGQARNAVDVAHAHFERVSIDLIYARPGHAVEAWRDELREALALGVRHLSAYQLTIEPGTAFYRLHAAGKLDTPPDDTATALFKATQELCAEAGLASYEVSNHAAPGEESRHNLIYWRYGDYVGVGPGAHGRIALADGARLATETVRDPAAWLEQVEGDGHGIETQTTLASLEQAEEMLLMGLRLADGVSRARLRGLSGHDIAPTTLEDLRALGLIAVVDERVRVTDDGRLLLNQIALKLADALNPVESAPAAATG
nr:radical SAM family heme chaperone HemW [Dichotomicrobium thermohalophilum]